MTYDVIIIGAGAIGAASALELSKAGQKVLLLEKNHVGAGASGASAALLEFQIDAFRGDPFFSLAKASRALFPALEQSINEISSLHIQFEPCGILQLAMTEADVAPLSAELDRQIGLGLRAKWMDNEWSRFGGVFFEEDGQVSGERFLKGLMKAAILMGAQLIEDVKISTLKKEANRIVSVETNQGSFKAAQIVVAAGAWSDDILATFGLKLGVEPIKGQLAVFDTPTRPLPFPLYTRDRGYIACKKDGYTLAGSTVEKAGFNLTASEETRRSLAERAIALVPALAKAPLRPLAMAGLRPGTPDELPFLGKLTEFPNVVMATGHFRNGILLAPITGQIVADLVLGKTPRVDISAFRPERFALVERS